jgi:hypothetical protein
MDAIRSHGCDQARTHPGRMDVTGSYGRKLAGYMDMIRHGRKPVYDVIGSYGRTLVIWMWLDRMDAPGRMDVTRHGRDFFLRMDIVEETK